MILCIFCLHGCTAQEFGGVNLGFKVEDHYHRSYSRYQIDPHQIFNGGQTDVYQFLQNTNVDSLLSSVGNGSVSSQCINDTGRLFVHFAEEISQPGNRNLDVFKVFDVFGKLPSGILNGNRAWLGDYDGCKNLVIQTQDKDIQMNFCAAVLGKGKTYNPSSYTTIFVGVCVPKSCNDTETAEVLQILLGKATNVSTQVQTAICDKDKPLETKGYVAIVILSIFGFWLVIGTVYDMYIRWRKSMKKAFQDGLGDENLSHNAVNERTGLLGSPSKSGLKPKEQESSGTIHKLLLSFSAWSNAGKILNTQQGEGSLHCLNGIRVISMWWVILGHTFAFIPTYLDNPIKGMDIEKRFTFQAILNGTFSVDSFFFLSGLLVCYLCLKQLKKAGGSINWAMFYVHRYIRLTPVYMIVLMFYDTLWKYTLSGPYSMVTNQGEDNGPCEKYWWTNLLYINNFVPGDKGLAGECMAWSWYLANDMQFFIISPFIIYLLYRFWWAGLAVIMAGIAGSLTTTGIISNYYEIPLGGQAPKRVGADTQIDYVYARPYTRIQVYLVGMAVGFAIYKTAGRVRMPKLVALVGWILCAGLMMSLVYGAYYPQFQGSYVVSQGVCDWYNAVSRCMWGVGLGWVTYACVTGYGGFINTFLSWGPWVPLGRITYCAYLVHPIIIFTYYMVSRVPFHYTDLTLIYLFIGNMVLSYGVAFLVSVCIEAPLLGIEKVLLKR